jgi:hypothetical protein
MSRWGLAWFAGPLCMLAGALVCSGSASTAGAATPGSRPAVSALLRQLVQALPHNRIESVRSAAPPARAQRPGRAWLYFVVRAANSYEFAHGYWEGEIVAALFQEASKQRGWRRMAGDTYWVQRPNGRRYYDGSGIVSTTFPRPPKGVSKRQLTDLLRSSASAAGCTLLGITFPKPLGRYAPKIVVRANQPSDFMADRNTNVATIMRSVAGGNGKPLVEGAFLEVQDANGKWLTVSGYVVPTGSGVGYTNPALPKP